MERSKIVTGKMVGTKTAKRIEIMNSGGAEGKRKINNAIESPNRLYTALTLALSACLLTGCRLAKEEAQAQNSAEDRLVGMLVTEEYVDSGAPELTMISGGEISFAENRERIEGTLIFDEHGPKDIVFDGIEGYGIYNIKMWEENLGSYTSYAISDDIFSDGCWAIDISELSETNTAEVTVYVGPDGPRALYFNPVYQTAQGDVYMQPGTGLSWGEGVEGVSSSTHTVSQERKVSENGEETVESSSFAVCITYEEQIVSCRLLFMDRDSNVADVMTGDELVKMWDEEQWELAVPAETAYLVLEQEKGNGDTRRVFCNRGEESLEFLQNAGGGYLVKQQMNILWE